MATKRTKRGRDDDSETPESEEDELDELETGSDASDSASSYASRWKHTARAGAKRPKRPMTSKLEGSGAPAEQSTAKPKPKPRPRVKFAKVDGPQHEESRELDLAAPTQPTPPDTEATVTAPTRRAGLRQRSSVNYKLPGPDDEDLDHGIGTSRKPRNRPSTAKGGMKGTGANVKVKSVDVGAEQPRSAAKATLQDDAEAESDLTELSS